MTKETWFLSIGDGPPTLRFASNAPAGSIDVKVAILPGVETFGVPYETWAKLRSGSVVIRVEDGRRVVESLPPEGPPPGPWPVRKVKEDKP